MNTFLNRLLALRIEDQNALFQAFEALLAGILERAAAAGALDRGLEDIDAEDVSVRAEEVVRTDTTTGAQTKLVTFAVRTRRELAFAEHALRGQDPAALTYAINSFVEIIAYTPRVFAPSDKPEVLSAILAKWPPQNLLSAAA